MQGQIQTEADAVQFMKSVKFALRYNATPSLPLASLYAAARDQRRATQGSIVGLRKMPHGVRHVRDAGHVSQMRRSVRSHAVPQLRRFESDQRLGSLCASPARVVVARLLCLSP